MKSVLISVRGPIRAVNVFFPRVERCVQLAYELRMLRGQIVPLARVRGYIKQIEVAGTLVAYILKELPASGAYCPLLMGTLDPPKELPLDEWRAPAQRREKIDSVEFVCGWDRRPRDSEDRCRQIHGDRHLWRALVHRQVSRPTEYQRDAYPAFPESALPVAQRRVAREPFSAIVICKNDQGVFRKALLVERCQNLSYALVGALEHANIIGARGWDFFVGPLI